MGAGRFDAATIANMSTQRSQSRSRILVALVVVVPLLAFLAFVVFIDLGNRSGECGQYYGDGTNDWEDCIELGKEVVENRR